MEREKDVKLKKVNLCVFVGFKGEWMVVGQQAIHSAQDKLHGK